MPATCSSRCWRAVNCIALGDDAGRIPQTPEKDAALERRFQPVLVDQPSVEDAISILRGLRERSRCITASASRTTPGQRGGASNRYISDRFLPDKAIDLVDEACAMIRTEMDSMRPSSTNSRGGCCNSKSRRLRSRRRRTRPAGCGSSLRKELADLREQANAQARWEGEKKGVEKVRKVREEIEQ